jgi:kynureninase
MGSTKWKRLAEEYDQLDLLSPFKEKFVFSDSRLIYLDGNSLGMLPIDAEKAIERVVSEEWGDNLISGWNGGWWNMPTDSGELISEIIGAEKGEVIVCDSTSVNLYKLVVSALDLRPDRKKIVSDSLNFPSDLYILEGVLDRRGEDYSLELVRSIDGIEPDMDHLDRLIDKDTALVVLTHVCYSSGFMYPLKEVTELAHSRGAVVIWDLCHSAGAVEVDLKGSNADMAVGCTYKYLNCGPGSPSFIYLRSDLQKEINSPIWGWIGNQNPFEFSKSYTPSEGVRQLLTGTPGILSMSTIAPSVKISLQAGIKRIREKSVKMTDLFLLMSKELLFDYGFSCGSPLNPEKRGSHISLRHPEGYRICKALIDPKQGNYRIIPDFRPPDNIRFGMAPLYNSYIDLYNTIFELEMIVKSEIYKEYDNIVEGVT